MPFIVTPRELQRRAEFYHQLQQLTAAGLPIVRSLEQLKRSAPSHAYRAATRELISHVEHGQRLAESLRAISGWLPEFDVMLIEAGEKSGRLDRSFRMLGDYYTDRAKVARRVIAGLAYPAFLVHLIAGVMTLVFFLSKPQWCLYPVIGLGILYVLVFVLVYATQNKHGEGWRSKVEFLLNLVPVVGTARRHLAIGRLSAALEALISAGVSIIEAWEMAARASGSMALQRTVESWVPMLRAGKTPTELLESSRKFPEIFTNQYAAGEVSGRLDETMDRMRDYYQESGGHKVQMLAQWIPIGIYLLVLIGGGAFVIWFWTNLYNNMWKSIGF